MDSNIKLTKSVIKVFLTNSVQLLEPSLDIKNYSCKDLAFHLAVILEQEESLQIISEDIKQKSSQEVKQDDFRLNLVFYTIFLKCVEKILSSLIEYMEYERNQEKYLSSQIGIVDFTNFSLLQKEENLNIYNLFSNSQKSFIGSALLGNFPQFCVSIAKKIEMLIDMAIPEKISIDPKTKEKRLKYKKEKLHEFIKNLVAVQKKSSNFYNNHQDTIEYIYDVRDCESHLDELGLSFEEKANQQYWTLKFRLDNLRQDLRINPMPIQETFLTFVSDYAKTQKTQKQDKLNKHNERVICINGNKLSIHYNPNKNYSYVKIYQLHSRYISGIKNIDDVANDIIRLIKEKYYFHIRFGENCKITNMTNKDIEDKEKIKRASELKQFVLESNYQKVSDELLWIVRQLEYLH